mmetsp:Transcript_10657/g.20616  ORF Transcript_10657/g.20616 Transcript_10657/m.20616 type:complete len:239 (+) Transcript_10657:1119-1835(+)
MRPFALHFCRCSMRCSFCFCLKERGTPGCCWCGGGGMCMPAPSSDGSRSRLRGTCRSDSGSLSSSSASTTVVGEPPKQRSALRMKPVPRSGKTSRTALTASLSATLQPSPAAAPDAFDVAGRSNRSSCARCGLPSHTVSSWPCTPSISSTCCHSTPAPRGMSSVAAASATPVAFAAGSHGTPPRSYTCFRVLSCLQGSAICLAAARSACCARLAASPRLPLAGKKTHQRSVWWAACTK